MVRLPGARGWRRRAMAAASPTPGSAARVGLLYDERMCAHATPDGEDHPENPERLRAIWRKLNDEGITSRCVVLKAKEAKDKHIASVHSQNHIKLMKKISSKKYNSSRSKIAMKFNSIYFNKGSSKSALLAAGSVIEVAEKVAAGELTSAIALVRPPGHHAEHDEPMGFCLFNNAAVAANYLLNERPDLGIKKILIVDWDVHHGNATQKMFYDDPRVLFFSVHRFDVGTFYPSEEDGSHSFIGEEAGKGYNINVPWEHGKCGDADYIAVWNHILLPVTEAFHPDIILISAGFDAALGDPLGGCCITPNGYALLLTKLLGFAQGRIVMTLEGGYNLRSTANSVFSCAKVLLGDKLTFDSSGMQPFESTWRIIQAVRNELKTCWPVFSNKLQEIASWIRPSASEVHFPMSMRDQLNPSSLVWPVPAHSSRKRSCDASVPGSLECSPTDRRRGKRAMKGIHRQMTPEARASEAEDVDVAEAEASEAEGFQTGHKLGCNAAVTATLEHPPTCFNQCKPTAPTDRRRGQMTPEVHAEAEDGVLAAADSTAAQRFLDVGFGSDSDYRPPTPPVRVSRDVKAGGLKAVQSGPTTATSLANCTVAAGLSDIQLIGKQMEERMLKMKTESARSEEHCKKMVARFDKFILKMEADCARFQEWQRMQDETWNAYYQQQQQFQATLQRGRGNTTCMLSMASRPRASSVLQHRRSLQSPGIQAQLLPCSFRYPAVFRSPALGCPHSLLYSPMPSGPSHVRTQPPATPSVISALPSASQLGRAAAASAVQALRSSSGVGSGVSTDSYHGNSFSNYLGHGCSSRFAATVAGKAV